jgi:hypothetical protein
MALEDAESKYDHLVRTSREEKARIVDEKNHVVGMEKSKRENAEKMEREWRQ